MEIATAAGFTGRSESHVESLGGRDANSIVRCPFSRIHRFVDDRVRRSRPGQIETFAGKNRRRRI